MIDLSLEKIFITLVSHFQLSNSPEMEECLLKLKSMPLQTTMLLQNRTHNLACWGPYVDNEDGILKIKTIFKNLTRPKIIPDDSNLAEIITVKL